MGNHIVYYSNIGTSIYNVRLVKTLNLFAVTQGVFVTSFYVTLPLCQLRKQATYWHNRSTHSELQCEAVSIQICGNKKIILSNSFTFNTYTQIVDLT